MENNFDGAAGAPDGDGPGSSALYIPMQSSRLGASGFSHMTCSPSGARSITACLCIRSCTHMNTASAPSGTAPSLPAAALARRSVSQRT